jgi:hypothetical protein
LNSAKLGSIIPSVGCFIRYSSMGKNNNLRGFLRSEVIKHQIRLPSPPKAPKNESKEVSDLPPSDESAINFETDSLFGDPILSRDEILEEKLKNFLSQSPKVNSPPHHSPSVSFNPALQELKDELKDLVYCGEEASHREKELIQRQRNALIEEIASMEDEEKVGKVKADKGMLFHLFNPFDYTANT